VPQTKCAVTDFRITHKTAINGKLFIHPR
jgi:hypothetical protein